jgi:hypothetical protein
MSNPVVPSSAAIKAVRAFLQGTRSVILPTFPVLEPTLADLSRVPNVSDKTITTILTTELEKKPSNSKRVSHKFNATSESWMVKIRPLFVNERVRVFDEDGQKHSRVANVVEDGDKEKVMVKFVEGDTSLVSRSSLWPDARLCIQISSLKKEDKEILVKAAIAFPPPSKSRIDNLISSAGSCDLERDVLLLLKKEIETETSIFPGCKNVKLHITDDGLLVDALLEVVKEGESKPRFVYIQAKTDSCAYNSLSGISTFGRMMGYGEEIVVISICTKTHFGAVTGKKLIEEDPWYALPVKETKTNMPYTCNRCLTGFAHKKSFVRHLARKRPCTDVKAVPLSTFIHFNGDNVKARSMGLTFSPPGTPDNEGTVYFKNESHNINVGFFEPIPALHWIAQQAISDTPLISVHTSRRFADYTFAPDADSQRKEACAIHVFKAKLALKDEDFMLPEAQNSQVDALIRSTAFLRVPELARLLRTSKKSKEFADIIQRIKKDDFYVRIQFKSLSALGVEKKKDGTAFVKMWKCTHFGKSIGSGNKGRYSSGDFDLSIFAAFDYAKETIDFRALWTSELIENNPIVFDTSETSPAGICFHCKAVNTPFGRCNTPVWAWTLALEEDAIRGCSVRFAQETDSNLDMWMMKLFKGSKKAGRERFFKSAGN